MSEEANQNFAEYVSSMSFALTLSKNQIFWLTQIANGSASAEMARAAVGRFDPVNAFRGLERRGLCYAPDPEWPGIKNLTEAGEHVMALLKLAGLVEVKEPEKEAA